MNNESRKSHLGLSGLRLWAIAKMLRQAAEQRRAGNYRMSLIMLEYARYFRLAKRPLLVRSAMDREHDRKVKELLFTHMFR